jgi:hypothetical protein
MSALTGSWPGVGSGSGKEAMFRPAMAQTLGT